MNKNNPKLVFLMFLIILGFSVFLIIFTFNKNIRFVSNIKEESGLESFMNKIYKDEGFLAYLERKKEDEAYYVNDKLVDTDGDGLSDFDEENIFFTSKYLTDSDGDGLSDFSEIEKGLDPNCPTGSSCDVYNTEISESELDYSVAQIRELLSSVVSEEYSTIFDSLTDDQIMNLFNNSYFKTQDIFNSISGDLGSLDVDEFLGKNENIENKENELNNNIDNNNSDSVNLFLDSISDLGVDQVQVISDMDILEIKNLFIDSGIFTKDFMDSFTDSEIMELLNVL